VEYEVYEYYFAKIAYPKTWPENLIARPWSIRVKRVSLMCLGASDLFFEIEQMAKFQWDIQKKRMMLFLAIPLKSL